MNVILGPAFARSVGIIASMAVLLTLGCRSKTDGANTGSSGEPEHYSATVVRTVEDGTSSETIISREARAGEQRREEWSENGRNRALIWRPDIGKAYLLDLDRRAYIETDIGAGSAPESQVATGNPRGASAAGQRREPYAADSIVQATEQYFSDAEPPSRVETQTLSSVSIDGHRCEVSQQTAIFSDGHKEITRTFRAVDLSGLFLRVECESQDGRIRVITERRGVQIGVAPGTFSVPQDFKRVQTLE